MTLQSNKQILLKISKKVKEEFIKEIYEEYNYLLHSSLNLNTSPKVLAFLEEELESLLSFLKTEDMQIPGLTGRQAFLKGVRLNINFSIFDKIKGMFFDYLEINENNGYNLFLLAYEYEIYYIVAFAEAANIQGDNETGQLTKELVKIYNKKLDNYFNYHVQQSGDTCAAASAAMYLRELKQATSVSEAAVISTAQRLGYNALDGLNSTETLNIINRYIKDHRTELRYPYRAKLFFDHTLSSDVRNARTYDFLTRSLSKYHFGVCMFFASYPPALPPVSGHTVYAIGVKRQVNKPYDLTAMTEMYLANPQYEKGSTRAIDLFSQAEFKRWLCMSIIYDGRL